MFVIAEIEIRVASTAGGNPDAHAGGRTRGRRIKKRIKRMKKMKRIKKMKRM